MAIISDFYKRLRDLCEQNGMTVNELAAALGLSTGSPTAWKNGTVPREKTIERISEYFGVSSDILTGQKEKAPTSEGERKKINTITIAGRDGSYVVKQLTDEQLQAFKTMFEHLPQVEDDL